MYSLWGWLRMLYRISGNTLWMGACALMGDFARVSKPRTGSGRFALTIESIGAGRRVLTRGRPCGEMSNDLESNRSCVRILDASGSTLDKTYVVFALH